MRNNFIIDKVSWHTRTPGNPESRERIISRFFSLAQFLHNNGFLKRRLAEEASDVNDEFEFNTSDLTDEGYQLMKDVYDKWLRKTDRGGDPSDLKLFDKWMEKARSKD